MRMSEVAKITELPISTIRYYEQIGIITDEYVLRDQNNYRIYATDIIHHLNSCKELFGSWFFNSGY